ncbi:SDR family NAD(P)-dependent oxidoreductase [Herbiconiux sp. A18JL235]|uniref:SDR family NAD(P)-dependent oxidoreductase n=1 Tax=Herbiconiux sp. A18JL235 TaxID=3152363 RepID=A0AB39BH77_9MICO
MTAPSESAPTAADADWTVVTGAASGIGRAVALDRAGVGGRLALLDIDREGLVAVEAEARAAGASDVRIWLCDVSDEERVVEVFGEVAAAGPITAVFSNAGIERNAPAHRMDRETWRRVLEINLDGCFYVCRAAVSAMLVTGGGSIVCTSSPAAFQGFVAGGNAAYAASKGGLGALVRSLAVDYAGCGIRVNAVVPGAVDTPILVAEVDEAQVDAARKRMAADAREQIPLGRMGRPEEIAKAVGWLFSDDSSYVTGTHLVCDGGLLARSANTF